MAYGLCFDTSNGLVFKIRKAILKQTIVIMEMVLKLFFILGFKFKFN